MSNAVHWLCALFRATAPFIAASLYASAAGAQVTQPDGTPIPVLKASTVCGEDNVQACLDQAEGGAGLVDAHDDALVTPERFNPYCTLTFTVVARGGGYSNVFGWYNAKPDPANAGSTLKPTISELHSFLLHTDGVGTTRTLELRSDPAYLGGEIGFFIGTGKRVKGTLGGPPTTYENVFYSERKFNPDNQATGPSYIHLLIWQSASFENAFYFGWEDLISGGDNDFDDLLTRVDGIQCSGSGDACDTGQPGICREGAMQCSGGVLQCLGLQTAHDETCNAQDDNCDGSVDEGDLCPSGQICQRGQCVGRCGEVVNTCKSYEVCSLDGLCVDKDCLDVECPEGQLCSAGQCTSACDGVVCPPGQACRSGRCLDPCLGMTCDEGQICDLGVCKVSCACTGCSDAAESACDTALGQCVEPACMNVSCNAGFACVGGTCIDGCALAICPAGEKCVANECIPACSDVSCEAGLKCVAGVCVDACVGIQCGPGLKCVAGAKNLGECVDGCLGVDCGGGKACKFGSCGTDCVGVTCPAGESCNAGSCSNLCSTLMCPAGEVCRAGACANACEGVTCPEGQVCQEGLCQGDPNYVPGLTDAGASEGGNGAGGASAVGGTSEAKSRQIGDSSGCACRAAPRAAPAWLLAAAGIALVFGSLRRGQRRRR